MRVITGAARGRKLKTLEGDEIIRPTTDRVKEAMFSIVQFDIQGARVLDLFAGSGQLGIEALSRGAQSAVFVDNNKEAFETVKENLKTTGLYKDATVLNTDSISYIKNSKLKFDLIIIDPPYKKGICAEVLPRFCRMPQIAVTKTPLLFAKPIIRRSFPMTSVSLSSTRNINIPKQSLLLTRIRMFKRYCYENSYLSR